MAIVSDEQVIKRDVLTLFNIRSPLLMEKLFLYLCMNSTELFSVTTAAKELENTSVSTIDSYIEALEMSNLIYLASLAAVRCIYVFRSVFSKKG